ncbi:hypothetical protein G6M89_16620 [Natronolimnobius sp. AArcel1]|uniref:YIP1 family protein n=1 Tax=Natronolimnobius sp. AArcel1 TaxID=1679093 RepID=UPI0013EB946C|nr:YIP1 family protein [Natronolimnobius sp. AArcel1]NGM70607.1 hypothetical protein [Natronolimnobius sp. AArcel1]
MIARLVTNPQAFVERQSKYPGIRTQSIIALLVGLAFAIRHAGTVAVIGDGYGHVSAPIAVLSLVELLLPFVIWGVVTVAIYYTARFVKGYFPPGLLFRLTGWGLVPLIAAGLIQSLGQLYALQGAQEPAEPSFSAFQYELEAYQSYTDSALGDPIFIAATVLAIPFVLYSGYIWATVVEEISDVSLREALYVSTVPTTLCLLWLASPFIL